MRWVLGTDRNGFDKATPVTLDPAYPTASPSTLIAAFAKINPLEDPRLYRNLSAAIQRVTTIKPVKKRQNVTKDGSRGSVLRAIEREIANLDRWQKSAAIEKPEGPQRIRGLAGSGEAVVLALKAAYLHTQHPDWQIAVTFHSRSLYQQFKDLIERFTLENMGDKPDWKYLHIMHSWRRVSHVRCASMRAPGSRPCPSPAGASFSFWSTRSAGAEPRPV